MIFPFKPNVIYYESVSKRFVRIENIDLLSGTGKMIDIESKHSIPITADYFDTCVEVKPDQSLVRLLYL